MPSTRKSDHGGLPQVCSVLSASPLANDHSTLDRIFRSIDLDGGANVHWHLSAASTLPSALGLLRQLPCAVVICERDLPPVGWKGLLKHLPDLTIPPLMIVTSLHADDFLWAEALNLGASDVLGKPFDQTEVARVMTSTYLRWSRERTQPEGGKLLRREVAGS